MTSPMLTVQQVSDRLNVSAEKVRELIDAGKIDAIDVSVSGKTRIFRISESALNLFIQKHVTQKTAEIGRAHV